MFLYSVLMLLVPVGTFYFSHLVIFNGDLDTMGYSGIFAVIAANVVVAAYVRLAWIEEQNDIAERKDKIRVD
jgi:hypothetical protein